MVNSAQIEIVAAGEAAWLVYLPLPVNEDYPAQLRALASGVKNEFPTLFDSVPSYRSVLLRFRKLPAEATLRAFLIRYFQRAQMHASDAKEVIIPVCYDADEFALDKDAICAYTGLSWAEVVRLHTARSYTVYSVGFIPGFAFLGFVDAAIACPRHQAPRAAVPQGSVGIAGKQTGFYPLQSPGGWQILGRTPMALYAPEKQIYTRVRSGDKVRFQAISREAYAHWSEA